MKFQFNIFTFNISEILRCRHYKRHQSIKKIMKKYFSIENIYVLLLNSRQSYLAISKRITFWDSL